MANISSTRERLLDAAEELFADHGFDGVTVRQVAKTAGVDVALPNYYFGSKRGLFDAVFHRRAALFNVARREAMAEVLSGCGHGAPAIRDLVAAFLLPIARAQSNPDPGWRNYCRLVALVNSSPSWVSMMTTYFDGLVAEFVEALQLALPDTPKSDLYWAYQFLSGGLSLTMADTGRIDRLSDGACRSSDYETAYAKMIALYSTALERLAETKRLEVSTAEQRT